MDPRLRGDDGWGLRGKSVTPPNRMLSMGPGVRRDDGLRLRDDGLRLRDDRLR
jgi:hypothetical protein